jgi:hypothetical protein
MMRFFLLQEVIGSCSLFRIVRQQIPRKSLPKLIFMRNLDGIWNRF